MAPCACQAHIRQAYGEGMPYKLCPPPPSAPSAAHFNPHINSRHGCCAALKTYTCTCRCLLAALAGTCWAASAGSQAAASAPRSATCARCGWSRCCGWRLRSCACWVSTVSAVEELHIKLLLLNMALLPCRCSSSCCHLAAHWLRCDGVPAFAIARNIREHALHGGRLCLCA